MSHSEKGNSTAPNGEVDLGNPPGVLGDITRQILAVSPLAQTGAAVNAALTLAGTALARKVCGETILLTNIYLISLIDNSEAAQQIQAAVARIAREAGLADRIVHETPTGGEALLKRVAATPNALFLFDDFDRLIKAALRDGAVRYKMELFVNLIKLFSSADTILHGTEFADQVRHPRVDIPYPCCSLHATAPAGSFYQMTSRLRSDHLRFLARFVVVDETTDPSGQRIVSGESQEPMENILPWFVSVRSLQLRSSGVDAGPKSLIKVEKSKEASRLFDDHEKEMRDRRNHDQSDGLGYLWSRGWELADKIALICACADNPNNSVVEERHAEWATQFVTRHTELLVNRLKAESDSNATLSSKTRARQIDRSRLSQNADGI
ncbi:hypothetical protein DRJ17_05835 [Candidatus Woesearchaeota archaeon]|nr:MAG: hypothetical protein DRJ17_05835 [Candidatus Woesearchaeota archaeon]